jgi:hypothetical protein
MFKITPLCLYALATGAVAISCAGSLSAAAIPILNSGFEADVLPCTAGPTCATSFSITGWTGATADPLGFSDPDGNGTGYFGVYKPSALSYPSGVPGGVNVAYVAGVQNPLSISQVLSTNLLANDTYTLTLDIGQRADGQSVGGLACHGFNAALEAGGNVLNSLVAAGNASCNSLTLGSFTQFTLTYTSAANPAGLGDPLEIVLSSFGAGGVGSSEGVGEIDFDNLALSDTSSAATTTAPEPVDLGLLASSALAFVLMRRPRAVVK